MATVHELRPVPGKLMLAGEYAVLAPGGMSLAVAVGELVRGRVLDDGKRTLTLKAYSAESVVSLATSNATGLARFACAGWQEAMRFYSWRSHSLTLEVVGGPGGKKLGLGASAAVVVAAYEGAMRACGLDESFDTPDDECRRAVRRVQEPKGSGYDVVAIIAGGLGSFIPSGHTFHTHEFAWPDEVCAAAFWTSEPAGTEAMLGTVRLRPRFLRAILDTALRLREAIYQPMVPGRVLTAVADCERAFEAAAGQFPHLLTPAMVAVKQRIADAGGVARTSGAGGGDCVLGFFGDRGQRDALAQSWRDAGGIVAALLPEDLAPPRRRLEIRQRRTA
jgi:phosphomevalonate kinase